MLLSDVYVSVAYIASNYRTEMPRETTIGTEVAYVTRDSDTTFKVKRSKVKVTRPLYSAPPRRLGADGGGGEGRVHIESRLRPTALYRGRGQLLEAKAEVNILASRPCRNLIVSSVVHVSPFHQTVKKSVQ